MPFEPSQSGNPLGRPPGVPNRVTSDFKQALNDLLESCAPDIIRWVREIAENDKSAALNHLEKLAEYCHPKLARTEHTGDKKAPVSIEIGWRHDDKG